MIADPRAVATRWAEPRRRTLAALATAVTEAPWSLTARDREHAAAAGLDDDAVLHVVALSSFFGHLNRIADATDVPLDYPVADPPPRAAPATPPLPPAPTVVDGAPAIDLARRPATAAALAAWRAELFERDPAHLPRARRAELALHVGHWLGANPAPAAPDDDPVVALARAVTLAPWSLGDAAFAALRAAGWADAALFDLCAVASSATVFARIDVALRALAR